jgi:hypothetical protein
VPGDVAGAVEKHGTFRAELLADAGEQGFQDVPPAGEQGVDVASLRHALARVGTGRDRIKLGEGDALEEVRQDARGEQAGDAAAGDESMTERASGHRRRSLAS